jgi:hypothetical protein
VQRVLGAWLGNPRDQYDAVSQVGAAGARFNAPGPAARVRIQQLRQHLGALTPVALALRDDLGELDGAGDRYVLQHRDARQPAAERLDDQRGIRVAGHRDRQRAHLAVIAAVPAQPEQPGDGVAMIGDAPGQRGAQRSHGLVIEHR